MISVLFAVACSNSGLNDLGHPPLSDDAGPDVTDTAPEALQTCVWVGVWELTAVNCGSFPFDEWYEVFDTTVMSLTHDPAGGCAVAFTWSGETCQESEQWQMADPVGTSVETTYLGVDDCSPADCTFANGDDACVIGDRTGTDTLTIDDSSGDLQVVGALAHGAPQCVLDLITTWSLQ